MTSRVWTSVLGVAFSVTCFQAPASAQTATDYFDRSDVQPVSEQTDPEVEPNLIPLGSFRLRPEVGFTGGYASNVLATELNEESDTFVGFAPKIAIGSAWSQHALAAEIVVDHREYSELDTESRTNFKLKLRGRLDLGEATSLTVDVKAADETEDRTALSNIATALEPNEYTQAGIGGRLEHQSGRFGVDVEVGYNTFDYDDTELAGELFQDQDFRDHSELSASARASYAMNRDVALFADVAQIYGDYDPPGFFNAFNRDYYGTVLLVGTDFELGDRVRGDIGLGYQYYTYDDDLLEDISDFAFAGEVDVMLTEATTLSAKAERKVIDPGLAILNAAIETGASIGLEQRLTRKLYVHGEAGLRQYAFETSDREDDRVDLSVGANWKINPNIWLSGEYELIDQTSDVQDFTDNRALLRMRIFP